MEIISQISSIITLVLFILYFIGKIIAISLEKDLTFEDIKVISTNITSDDVKIVDEYTIEDFTRQSIIFTSQKKINWIKIYECSWNDEKNTIIYGKLVAEHGALNSGYSVKFNVHLPECLPSYILKFERNDFLVGELYLTDNMKNGIVEEHMIMHHTWKSIFYYLVK